METKFKKFGFQLMVKTEQEYFEVLAKTALEKGRCMKAKKVNQF